MRCNNFRIEELVTQRTFKLRGEKAWSLLDNRMLATLDSLRIRYGPIIVNNWHLGGNLDERGLRDPGTTTGATFSQHFFGRAADCTFTKLSAEEVRKDVLKQPHLFPHITALETDITWFHFDCRNHDGPGRILTFKP